MSYSSTSDLQLMQRCLEMNPSPICGDFCSSWDSIGCWLEWNKTCGFYRQSCFGRRSFSIFLICSHCRTDLGFRWRRHRPKDFWCWTDDGCVDWIGVVV